jgi:hypothetical protein
MSAMKTLVLALALAVAFPLGCFGQTAVLAPCSARAVTHNVGADAATLWHGIKNIPRNAIRPANLAWELPVGAATGILIAEVDRPAVNRIQSKTLQASASRWTNIGLGIEIGGGALGWTAGCIGHRSALSEASLTALTALGAAGIADLGLKVAFDRQYPYSQNSTGSFWGGGRSFPSGHSAMSFAFASTFAHRYPHNPWIKWGAYALAASISLSRYPAKKHYPSDILVGATLGYMTGSYIADHTSH